MSRASKIFFACSVVLSGGTIYGVHYIQQQERITMFQGVLKDDIRLAAKRTQRAREAEFEEQARKRAYLEEMQGVSGSKDPMSEEDRRRLRPTKEQVEEMEFGCKDCEKEV